ncbi:transcription factor [Cryptococcus deuterogattii 99/473]|uniref:Unplaced genomic scaffold supercont1.19, whole genome shotgun sequence n=1 Tax=Cryptococcus deuterogattii Ram5 TaxID=1296110 RepID=A0A0D0SX45_9TREE|nr:transcription factor [Cryptococcus deuterogattii Ram5]KIY55398.1 transcription factor [Cryptococcus deuterogattii 99/473]
MTAMQHDKDQESSNPGAVHDESQGHESEDGGGNEPAKRVRRRVGPFKRSRTGCGTCKRRGKKCDEEWTAEGHCQRCIIGQFECTGRTNVQSKSAAKRAQQQQRSKSMSDGNLQRESSESQWSSTDMQPSGSVSATLNHSHIDQSSIQAATAQQFLSHSTPSASSNHNQQTPPNPLGTTSSTQQETNVPFAWYNPTHAPPSAPRHDPATFLTIDHSQSLFDWSSMFSNQPSTLLTSSTECGALALESIMPWTGGSNEDVTATASGSGGGSGSRFGLGGGGAVQVGGGLWNDGVFGVQNQLGPSGPSQDGVGQVLGGVSPNTVDKHMRDGVSLSDLYVHVIKSWLVGAPSSIQENAHSRLRTYNNISAVMQFSRHALARAYMTLFSSSMSQVYPLSQFTDLFSKSSGNMNNLQDFPVPDLISEFNIHLPRDPKGKGKEKTYEAGQLERRMREYEQKVLTRLIADEESLKWIEDETRLLREVIVTSPSHLAELLWGVINLRHVEYIRSGASQSYNVLALGDRLVRSALGSSHPPITLSKLQTAETWSVRMFAAADIGRCIVERGRKTIFNFWSDIPADPSSPPSSHEEPWSFHLGLPDSILILLAEIVNLSSSVCSSSSLSIKAQADELEKAIRGWQSHQMDMNEGMESGVRMERIMVGELWRLSALVLLYESVHRVGGLHPVLRNARYELLNLLDSLIPLTQDHPPNYTALPAFLAATLSTSCQDRHRSMMHLLRVGPEKVWMDNVAVVEKIWEESDTSGVLPDWWDKMKREGMSVAFF